LRSKPAESSRATQEYAARLVIALSARIADQREARGILSDVDRAPEASMSVYRNQLPQVASDLFMTDGGLETTLIFHEGIDLPYFAAEG